MAVALLWLLLPWLVASAVLGATASRSTQRSPLYRRLFSILVYGYLALVAGVFVTQVALGQ